MKKKTVMLQPSEWIIMEKLWENPPQTVMQLYHMLEQERGWSKSTVTTMLRRMTDKALIRYEEGERARQYYPCVAREDAAAAETESLLERVYDGSVSMMMNTLLKNSKVSREDIRELYRILGEAVDEDV